MLQKQLKKMEELYKNTLNKQQDVRFKYFNVVQELAHQNIVCNKLKEGAMNLGNEDKAYIQEKEALQMEVEKLKKEYDQLMKSTIDIKENTCTMNHTPNDDKRDYKKEKKSNPGELEELLEHYLQIKQALTGQNDKLDRLLENIQVIGDGSSTIIKSLEGIRCVNQLLSKSLSHLTVGQSAQSLEHCCSMKESNSEAQQHVSGDGKCEICKEIPKGNRFLRIHQQKLDPTESLCSENCCNEYFLEKDKELNACKQITLKEDTATIDDESCCLSGCSCFSPKNSSVPVCHKTNEKACNTDCDCLNYLYEFEKIDNLRQLITRQPERLPCDPCSDAPQEDGEGQNKLKEENDRLKSLVGKLEDDLQKVTADRDHASEELERARVACVETLQQSDKLLEEYETSLEETNEKYLNTLTQLGTLKNENNMLQEKVKHLYETDKKRNDQCCLCKTELDKANTRVIVLEDSIKEMEGNMKERENRQSEEFANVKAQNLEITKKYNELKTDYDALLENNKENELLRVKNENLARELDERDALIYDLGEQVVNLEQDLNTMRKEVSESSETASREMNVLLSACVKLESQLEITKDILVNETCTEDAETNTACCSLASEMNSEDVDELKTALDEKTDEIERLLEELAYSKNNYEKDLKILRNKIELLQMQLERVQDEHNREVKAVEEIEKPQPQLEEEYAYSNFKSKSDSETETIEDRVELEVLNKISSTSELSISFERTQEQNQNLKRQLERTKRELNSLKGKTKEFGKLKAENSKLKEKISAFQKLLSDMKNVEENLKKSEKDKEEMTTKVVCLEERLNAMQTRRSTDKINTNGKPSGAVQISEDETVRKAPTMSTRKSTKKDERTVSCDDKGCPLRIVEEKAIAVVPTTPARKSKIKSNWNDYEFPCAACGDKKYKLKIDEVDALAIVPKTQQKIPAIKDDIGTSNCYEPPRVRDDKGYRTKTHVKIMYQDKKSKTSDRNKQRWFNFSTVGTIETEKRLKKIQMHVQNIKQREKQVAAMTVSLHQENLRLSEYNISRFDREKAMEFRLHQLKHKRQQLSNNFNHFQKEVEFLEYGSCRPYDLECEHLHCNCHSRKLR